jgi:hypothetical protein
LRRSEDRRLDVTADEPHVPAELDPGRGPVAAPLADGRDWHVDQQSRRQNRALARDWKLMSSNASRPRRRITDRQAAVLAAVERLGRPSMPELHDEFPHLAPSTIWRALEALEARGLVESAGASSERYVGGVRWWSTAHVPTQLPAPLEQAWAVLVSELSDEVLWRDPVGGFIACALPFGILEQALIGRSAVTRWGRLQETVASVLVRDPRLRVQLLPEVRSTDREHCLVVRIVIDPWANPGQKPA